MKKLLSVLLLLCMLVSLLSAAALAASGEATEEPAVKSEGEAFASGEGNNDAISPDSASPDTSPDESANGATNEIDAENAASGEIVTESIEPEDAPVTDTASDEPTTALSLEGGAAKAASCSLYVVCHDCGDASVTVNGEAASRNCSVSAGDKVVITADLLHGYEKALCDWTAMPSASLSVTESPAGSFTFTVPEGVSVLLFELNFATADGLRITYHYGDSTDVVFCKAGSPVHLTDPSTSSRVITGFAVGSENGPVLPVDSYQSFTEDTDLYAIYAQGIQITYHPSQTKTYKDYAAPGVAYSIWIEGQYGDSYIVAWSTEPDGGGRRYEANGSYLLEQDTELYPIYAQDVVTVTYHYRTQSHSDTIVPRGGLTYVYYLVTFFGDFEIENGDTLKYWAIGSPDSAEKCLPGQNITANENLDLYAVLAEETVTLTYNYGLGSNSTNEITVPKNSDVLLRSDAITTPFGKALAGWALTEGGALLGETAVFSEDTTLYAVWGDEILVTYDANGGLGSCQFTQAAGRCIETEITAEDGLFTRDGYTLIGWSTTADGLSPYDFSTPIEADTTLYAIWRDNNAPAATATPAPTTAPASAAKHSPQTGDDSSAALWMALMGASILAFALLLTRRKRFDK